MNFIVNSSLLFSSDAAGSSPAGCLSLHVCLAALARVALVIGLGLGLGGGALRADTWRYDWSVRTDRDGRPAGIYEVTPYPITETTTSYAPKSDEAPAGKTYVLGTKYYVDGLGGNDANSGLEFTSPKKTILSAIRAAGSGNRTIVIRGAHDTFDGIYRETLSFSGISGLGDTNRFMLTGYGQERPILDAGNSTAFIITRKDPSLAYITLQRLKLQNTQASGVRLGWAVISDKRDRFFNCVDLWFYACGNNDAYTTDGSCYYLNADDGLVSHCTSEYSVGHGYKMGDGASRCIVEWSISRFNGWWPGKTSFGGSRPCAIDFPVDAGIQASNNVARYNLGYSCLFHGLQVRQQANFLMHHNEIYDFGHGIDMQGNLGGVVPSGVLVLGDCSGTLRQNVFHDPYSANAGGIVFNIVTSQTNADVLVVNNVVYGAGRNATLMELGYQNAARTTLINNTLVASNAFYTLCVRANQGWTNEISNNILVQLGTGSCGELLYHKVAPKCTYNLYYAPSGAGPEWGVSGTGERTGNPLFQALPSGTWGETNGYLQATSPAVGMGFRSALVPDEDFRGRGRSNRVDAGAVQYFIPPARNLRILE